MTTGAPQVQPTAISVAWAAPPQPQQAPPAHLTPPISGPVPQNPPGLGKPLAQPRAVEVAWLPPPPMPEMPEPVALGFITGNFLHHYTGVLVPDSKLPANQHSNAELFEQFVPHPVDLAIYEASGSPFDLGFTDSIRFYAQALHASLGRGIVGAVALKMQVDSWIDGGSDSFTWVDWSVGTITARRIRARIVMTLNGPGAGAPAYVDGFTPAADKLANSQGSNGAIAVAAGGTVITFATPYHNVPAINVTGQGLVGWYTSPSATGFTMHVGTDLTHDTGGNGSWSAQGA